MNSSLILSTSSSSPVVPACRLSLNDRNTYRPAVLTYERFAEMYATGHDLYTIHFFSVSKAIVEIAAVGPHMPFIYSRRARNKPLWTGLPPKFNDDAFLKSITESAVLVFADNRKLRTFRDLMCVRLPSGVRYCLYPKDVPVDDDVDDTVIEMARYYRVHGHLY